MSMTWFGAINLLDIDIILVSYSLIVWWLIRCVVSHLGESLAVCIETGCDIIVTIVIATTVFTVREFTRFIWWM